MKKILIIIFLFFLLNSYTYAKDDTENSLRNEIIAKLIQQYENVNFSVHFKQKSKLKALDMEDFAEGDAFFKHPESMRWEYSSPEEQVIVSNGKKLWIYRKAENQVLVGNANDYFKEGAGISFLSSIKEIVKHFNIHLEEVNAKYYVLKLNPKKKKPEIDELFLEVKKKEYIIEKIVNYNIYGDETMFELSNFNFNANKPNSFFTIDKIKDADIIQMEQ